MPPEILFLHILHYIDGYQIFITIFKHISSHTILILYLPIYNIIHISKHKRHKDLFKKFHCSDELLFLDSSINFIPDTENITTRYMLELDEASILVYVEEANYEFFIGFIPPTNLRIFKISNLSNIEASRWITHDRNFCGQVWIPLSTIFFVNSISNSNNNLLNLLVTCNIPYLIGTTIYSTSLIGTLDQFLVWF